MAMDVSSGIYSLGCFDTKECTSSFIYHPTLNVIILVTKDATIKVLDLHSGKSLSHAAIPNTGVFGAYLPGVDKLLLCDGRAVSVRRDHNGILLLQSALQTPVQNSDSVVQLDIPLSEATTLAQVLKQADVSSVLSGAEDAAVATGIQQTLQNAVETLDADRIADDPKAAKWSTVCLKLPLQQLRTVFSTLLSELLRCGCHIPATSHAAAAVERLYLTRHEASSDLAYHGGQPDRRRMFSEAARRQTFSRWPHMHYKWALPDQMAQAGFYHQPNQSGDDMAMCFTCTACLVCWEPTDEPWSEHERHSPSCPFVKGEHTENVPLSVTESTEPARPHGGGGGGGGEPATLLAPSAVPHLVVTGTRSGHLVLWSVATTLTRELSFQVHSHDALIEASLGRADADTSNETVTQELQGVENATGAGSARQLCVGALCLLAPPEASGSSSSPPASASPPVGGGSPTTPTVRPCLVVGARIRRRTERTESNADIQSPESPDGCECDFAEMTDDGVLSNCSDRADTDDLEQQTTHQACFLVYDIKQQATSAAQLRSAADAAIYSHSGGGHTKKLTAPPPDGGALSPNAVDKETEFADPLMNFLVNKDAILSSLDVAPAASPPAGGPPSGDDADARHLSPEPPSLIQYLALPHALNAAGMSVTSLQPSGDGAQLVVLAAPAAGPDLVPGTGGGAGAGGALLLYPLKTDGPAVTLRELPAVMRQYAPGQPHPVQVTVIPAEHAAQSDEEAAPEADDALLAVLLSSGELQVLSAVTLETVASLLPPGSGCLGTAYCNSQDCLIACTESGELRFLPLTQPGSDVMDGSGSPASRLRAQHNRLEDASATAPQMVVQLPLTPASLAKAHELTRLETLTPVFSAVVPPCWAEIQQAQKQRRHPRLIQTERHHTRTWRLLHDGPVWKQHVFEITLPRAAPVAHVNLRFSLVPLCTSMPHVEATLVRSATLPRQPSAAGATNAAADHADAGDDGAEVLCGPVDLRTCLDMSGQGGTVTFTSTELMTPLTRTFSIRLTCATAVNAQNQISTDSAEQPGASFLPDLQTAITGTVPVTVDKLAAAGVKSDHITGCDCFQEVSVTIRRVRHSSVAYQRVQRFMMLETLDFHAALMDAACRRSDLEDPLFCQTVALDVLLWLAALRTMHNAVTKRTAPFVQLVRDRLRQLVTACFLHGTRAIAHKCARLIVLCIEASRGSGFSVDLFNTLLELVPAAPGFQSPGALSWYFVLLNHTKRLAPQQAAAALIQLLSQVVRQLGTRANPLHDILKSRYGLHGCPLEEQLFDVEPPSPLAESAAAAATSPGSAASSDGLETPGDTDLRHLLAAPGRGISAQTERAGVWSALAADEQLRGLVEVEPLHYTCHASSDCTRLEWQPGTAPGRMLTGRHTLGAHKEGPSTAKLEEAIADVEKKAAELQALVTQKPDQASGRLLDILQHVSREVAGARKLTEQLENQTPDQTETEPEPDAAVEEEPKTAPSSQQLTDPMLSVLLSPWHHLLVPPMQHAIVIDRMHSGARRFVVIDFGAVVLLTDIIMPTCADLLLLSVDAWIQHEETDGQRLVVAPDIGYRRLVMTDLQPPPVCRYLKITTVGGYGMTTTRCRIPMASFYGHTVQMPWQGAETHAKVRSVSQAQAKSELGLLTTLHQEVHCQYSLACERLRRLLLALPAAPDGSVLCPPANDKVPAAYQECSALQQQAAVVQHLVRRLHQYCFPSACGEAAAAAAGAPARLRVASTSQLRRVCDHALEALLALAVEPAGATVPRQPQAAPQLSLPLCRLLLSELCVHAAPRQQLAAGALMLAAASALPWWGQLVADSFTKLFTHSEERDFSRHRLFVLLTYLGQRTMSRGGGQARALLEALLGALCGHLAAEYVDVSLVEWMLLYLATLIETLVDGKELGRWKYLAGERALLRCQPGTANARAGKGYRRRLLTRLKNHKHIDELLNVKKLTMGKSLASSNLIGLLVHNQSKSDGLKKKQFKYVKAGSGDSRRDAATSTSGSSPGGAGPAAAAAGADAAPMVGRDVALRLVRLLMYKLLDSQLMVTAELMMTGCKVVSWVASAARPTLRLCELVTAAQLECLLRAGSDTATVPLTWRGPWTPHTVQCFIQEVLQAERWCAGAWGGGSGGSGSASTETPPSPPEVSRLPRPRVPRPPAAAPAPAADAADAADGSSNTSGDGSGTPEEEEEDSPSPSVNPPMTSDKLQVHMFPVTASGEVPAFSSFYPFSNLSDATAPTSVAMDTELPTTAAQTNLTPDAVVDIYSDASQEGVCLLPPMMESEDDGDPLMLDDFVMDIFDASLAGDKKPPLPSDAVKWGLLPAPGSSWALSNDAGPSSSGGGGGGGGSSGAGGLGKLGSGWAASAGGSGSGGPSAAASAAAGGSCTAAQFMDMMRGDMAASAGGLTTCSTATDARLEVGLTAWPELRLRKMGALHSNAVVQAVSGQLLPAPSPPDGQAAETGGGGAAGPAGSAAEESARIRIRGQDMVADGLAMIHTSLQYSATPATVESLLELWLSLDCACTAGFQRSLPMILQAVRVAGRLSLRGWTLLFQALTARKSPDGPSSRTVEQTAEMLLCHDLVEAASPLGQVLNMFLTQSVSDVPGKQECGVTVCRWFDALLVSLMSVPTASCWSVMLLELLWMAAHAPGFPEPGAPLDALSRLVQRMLQLSYPGSELGSIVGLIQVIVCSVQRHLTAAEQARCGRGTTSSSSSDAGAAWQPDSAVQTLLVELLRLATLLLLVPLRPNSAQAAEAAPQTDELKASSGAGASGAAAPTRPPSRQMVLDRVLENGVIVEQLLNSASLVAITAQDAQDRPEQQEAAGRPASAALAAALDDLLSTLVCQSTDRKQLARATVLYLASRTGGHAPRISRLLLNFLLKLVNSDSSVAATIRHRGLEPVFENLLLSCRAVSAPLGGVTSQMMRHVWQRQRRPAGAGGAPLRRGGHGAAATHTAKLEDVDGLINVAPLSIITCSNPMALQPEVLVQPTAPHRRSRNPAWSHHFYSAEERSVELHVRLPCAVLLHQVQLQPHASSLATCPSAVTVEVSSGGPSGPVCTSLPTAGFTFIGIELPRPTVTTEVTVRLHRPADSSNLGLTQLRLLASTTLGAVSPRHAPVDTSNEECHLWLRLLDVALTPVADAETLDQLCALPRLLERCRGLLAAAACRPDSAQRAVRLLLRLGRHQTELGLGLVRLLLRRPPPAGHHPVRLLYQLTTTDDQFLANRVYELMTWLRESAVAASGTSPLGSLHASIIHCIAAIFWKVAELSHEGVLELIPADLTTVVYDWCSRLPADSRLKQALDWVLCALCHLQPALLPPLLQTMGVLVPPGGRRNVTDDRKDMEAEACAAVSDDDKHAAPQQSASGAGAPAAAAVAPLLPADRLELGAGQLATLAALLQAPAAAVMAIDSGLMHAVLVQAVHDCCRELGSEEGDTSSNSLEMEDGLTDTDKQSRAGEASEISASGATNASHMAALLSLLGSACRESRVRDWLGSDTATVYWLSLPRLLAARPARQLPAQLEPQLLRLLAGCCHTQPVNQRRLAATICDVLAAQLERPAGCRPRLQGFTRRLVLSLLLESERVEVLVQRQPPAAHQAGAYAHTGLHPRHWHHQLITVKTDTTVGALLQTALGTDISSATLKQPSTRSEKDQKNQANAATAAADMDHMLVPLAQQCKTKLERKLRKVRRKGTVTDALRENGGPCEPRYELLDLELSERALPSGATLSQLMTLRTERLFAAPPAVLVLTLRQRDAADWPSPSGSLADEDDVTPALLAAAPFPSVLSVFAEEGGLALLAATLPLLLPEGSTAPPPQASARTDRPPPTDLNDAEWVKVEQAEEDEYVSNLMLSGGGGGGGVSGSQTASVLPPVMSPHSLACFGLFLRLPGYAELLLRDQVSARYLLRLALGVTDDGDGNEIVRAGGPCAELPLYPVQLMQRLLDATQLTTDDGQLLRRRALDIGAVNFLLACTAVLSHTPTAVQLPALEYQLILATTRSQLMSECQGQRGGGGGGEDRSHQYWAKGTGFGTGSTSQKWNVEQAMLKQKSEEEHVTWLIQTLASYINPGDCAPAAAAEAEAGCAESAGSDLLPAGLAGRIGESSILSAVCSYLRNDSVLDMARHVPLYGAVLRLLRAFAGSAQLAPLLAQVAPLLANMRQVVDTYTSHLHSNKPRKPDKNGGPAKSKEEEDGGLARLLAKIRESHLQSNKSRKGEKGAGSSRSKDDEDGGLARLLANIQETWRLVSAAVAMETAGGVSPAAAQEAGAAAAAVAAAGDGDRSLQQIYLDTMKPLQFDTFEMIVENPSGGTRFAVSHHFESTMRGAGERSHPARMKRLAQETVTLSTSLPLSFSSTVFVRVDLGRLDMMKVLITAPADTPYSNGCFVFDVYFPYDYPNSPMLINLDTTGRNTVRFNPNLYNDGKVCLSVLNTWHGRPEEKWNSQTSSFLQVLVSIQSLILVSEPYFNEPGYERSRGTPSGTQSSREYDANIRQATVRWAMLEQIRKPCPSFKDVIERHFFLKRTEIIEQVQSWITEMEGFAADRRASKTLHVSLQALKTHFAALQEELKKLKSPPGLETVFESADPAATSADAASAAGTAAAAAAPAQHERPTVGLSPSGRPPTGLNAIPELAGADAVVVAAGGVVEKVKSAAAAAVKGTVDVVDGATESHVNGVDSSAAAAEQR